MERTQRTSNRAEFPFFLNLPWIFPKGTSRNQTFLFFHYFFRFFSKQESQKMQPQKLEPTTEVGCGLQKFSKFSEKRTKPLTNFFFIFLNFFGNFDETKQGKAEFWSGPNGVKKLL